MSVSDELVEEAYKKHFLALTTDDPLSAFDDRKALKGLVDEEARAARAEGIMERLFRNPASVELLNEVARGLAREYRKSARPETLTPSTSACFEATRGDGGQYVAIREYTTLVSLIGGHELVRMQEHAKVYTKDGLRFNVVRCTYNSPGQEIWEADLGLDKFHTVVRCRHRNYLRATIQVVLEPLKMRIISKGEALPYYWMKPLQKALHTAIRDIPCFRLVGRSISPTDLMDLINRPSESEDILEWHSVDYSAATDGLSSRLGLRILDYLLQWEFNGPISEEVKLAAMRVLGPHELWYPTRGKDGKQKSAQFKGIQRNGQLMGSILSFPILCIANAMVYADVTSAGSLSDFNHVLINGDDMLYRGTEKEWERHVEVGKSVGLEMSVGKAYRHPVYANVNSTGYHYDLRVDNSTPWQIDFLNMGLIFGQHKVQNKEETAASHHEVTSFAACIDTVMNGCLPGRQSEILSIMLSFNKEAIDRETASFHRTLPEIGRYQSGPFTRNLFLPFYLGGMGATAPPGWQVRVTPVQRRVAAGCLAQSRYQLHSSPLPGFEVLDLIETREPWLGKAEATRPESFPSGRRMRQIPYALRGGCDECRSACRS
jgi:hypothetical protein